MKPPVSIDALMEEWSKDSAVDETEPGRETGKIPSLHAKYLRILTHHNLICKKLTTDYNRLKRIKFEYYSGDLNNPEDLEHYGFEPMNKKLLKTSVPTYVDSDDDLNNILMKKMVHQEIVDFCTSVMKELNNRTFQLGNIIKWEQFSGGR
jgi:hypothetical protein